MNKCGKLNNKGPLLRTVLYMFMNFCYYPLVFVAWKCSYRADKSFVHLHLNPNKKYILRKRDEIPRHNSYEANLIVIYAKKKRIP